MSVEKPFVTSMVHFRRLQSRGPSVPRPNTRSTSLLLVLFVFICCSLTSFCDGAHSRKRVVATSSTSRDRYDRVVTDFSPDGRLSQVDYGLEAARRGATIMAATLPPNGLCFVVQGSVPSSSSSSPSFGKVHRLDHHVWLVTAGLSGDARLLAGQLRRYCRQHRLQYGEAPTTKQVAKWAGEWQHSFTLVGGLRPLGCAAFVVGMDETPWEENGEENENGSPRSVKPCLYQTDPGGVVEELSSFGIAGKANEALTKPLAALLDSKGKTTDLNQIAASLAQCVLSKMDHPKAVDVWLLQGQPGNRGNVEATCYPALTKENVAKIRTIRAEEKSRQDKDKEKTETHSKP